MLPPQVLQNNAENGFICCILNSKDVTKTFEINQNYKHLQHFLDDTYCLDPFPSGFKPDYGTETSLVALVDDLREGTWTGGVRPC